MTAAAHAHMHARAPVLLTLTLHHHQMFLTYALPKDQRPDATPEAPVVDKEGRVIPKLGLRGRGVQNASFYFGQSLSAVTRAAQDGSSMEVNEAEVRSLVVMMTSHSLNGVRHGSWVGRSTPATCGKPTTAERSGGTRQ